MKLRASVWVVSVLLTLAVSVSPANAAAAVACTVENRTQGIEYPPDGGPSLAQALSAANEGDKIVVFGDCVGAYVIDKSLILRGAGGQEPALLHRAPSGDPIVVISGEGTVKLRHLDIVDSSLAVGLEVTGSPEVRVVRVRILSHYTDGRGAGLEVDSGAHVSLVHTTIADNYAELGASGISNAGELTLRHSTVFSNHVSDGEGAGITNWEAGMLTLFDSVLIENSANGEGGGLYNLGHATLVRSEVTSNTAHEGGGIWSRNGTVTLRRTVVSGNEPDNCYPRSICN